MSLAQILGLQGPSKIPKRFAPFYQQAGSEALVRYAPEWDNLSQLRAASAQTMRQRVAQARTAGAILNNAAGMAIKDIQSNPNASSPALQSLLPMLTQRQQDAPIVANQQALQATNEHLQDLDKIHAQRASLLGQIGTFTIGRATDLVGSDRKLRHDVNTQKRNLEQQANLANQRDTTTRRGQDLSHTDRQASIQQRKQAAAKKAQQTKTADAFKSKYGVPLRSAGEHGTKRDSITNRLTDATAFKKGGFSRHDAAAALIAGIPNERQPVIDPKTKQPVIDPATGKPKTQVKQGVKAWGNSIWTSIALDLAYDGHISAKNAALLHRQGISVARLGLPTAPTSPRQLPAAAPGIGSQGSRPN